MKQTGKQFTQVWHACMPAALAQWEREVQLFIALKQLTLFRQHKLWKAFKTWKRTINTAKMSAARASLNKQLFLLSPVFQGPLQQFHMLCHQLSAMRVHNMRPGQVIAMHLQGRLSWPKSPQAWTSTANFSVMKLSARAGWQLQQQVMNTMVSFVVLLNISAGARVCSVLQAAAAEV